MNPTRHVFSAIAATSELPSGPDTGYLGELVKAAAVGTIPSAGHQERNLHPFFGAEAHVKMASAWDKIQDTVGSDWGYLVAPAAGAAIGAGADLGLAGLNKLRGKVPATKRTPGLRGALLGAIAGLSGKFAVDGMGNIGEGMIPPAKPGETKDTGGLSALGALLGGAPAYAMSGMKNMRGNAISALQVNGILSAGKNPNFRTDSVGASGIVGTDNLAAGKDENQIFRSIRALVNSKDKGAPIMDLITGRSQLNALKGLMGVEGAPHLNATQRFENAAAGKLQGAFDSMNPSEQRQVVTAAGVGPRAALVNSWDHIMKGIREAKTKWRGEGSTLARAGGVTSAAGRGVGRGIVSRPVGTLRTIGGTVAGAVIPGIVDRNTTDLQKDMLEALQRTVYKD